MARTESTRRTTARRTETAKRVPLKEAVIRHLIATRNKAEHVKDLYAAAVEEQGHVPGAGATPLATLAAGLITDERFERPAPNTFRMTSRAFQAAKRERSS